MPRDQKIGLALGILLVGAVAAFFFRHDQTQTPTLPALKTAADLDRQIATYDRAPYLQSDEPVAPPPHPIAETVTDDEFPEPLDGAGLVPDPVIGSEELTLADTPPATGSNDAPAALRRSEHLVQRGETLSSIAAKYLGSANRYEDLFRANADQLRDPNDVRPGMTLRIPEADNVAGAPPRRIDASTAPREPSPPSPPQPTNVAGGAGQPLSATGGTKKFVPYGRSPLTTPEVNGTALEADPKAAAKRRMSLNPPRDGNVIR